ncbi:putative solute carrier family 35 member [Golovinomyces cichoracearum]|uniref:Putative solute carrier family 35 member n=1 Tax=Golovinomyces cichoracearum TaxID=62708 RepID=A0A420J6J4_9PEZI|nr:putative solute carrier family 35 member [Golovinomyces cichoracearum]
MRKLRINTTDTAEISKQNSRPTREPSVFRQSRDDTTGPRGSGARQSYGTTNEDAANPEIIERGFEAITNTEVAWYAYVMTRDFWIVLALGQVLALCITATNTFSTLLVVHGTSIPTFQTLFNYITLSLIFTSYTLYKYGITRYLRLLRTDGWKYAILSFLDVEGNYFTVLAYRYTNLLSAQLLNFWAIVCVVVVSFTFLHVRYKSSQYSGIFFCCCGMGILLVSDHLTGANEGSRPMKLKGDLFGLVGATFYGLSNVFEEWLVSRRPIYEVLGMLGLFGILINGATAAIFDRDSFAISVWSSEVFGYIIGYSLSLTIFYSLAPLILRMASAAFFDISLLTSNFWGVVIGIEAFGYTIFYLYPIAFVLIIVGLVVYFLSGSMLGDSYKPWLGKNQENGVVGIGTAKRKVIKETQREGLVLSQEHV